MKSVKDMHSLNIKRTYLVVVSVLILFIISFLNISNVKANERNIINLTISEGGEISPPVFDLNDGVLNPGSIINKYFVLKNTTEKKYTIEKIGLKDFKIKDINGEVLDINNALDLKVIEEFYEAIECRISCEGFFDNKLLYSDDIKDLIQGKTLQKNITISSGNEKKINVSVSMKKSSGNNMQGLQANFNIVFNATSIDDEIGEELPTPIEPPVITTAEPSVVPLPVEPSVEIPVNEPIATTDIPSSPDDPDTMNPEAEVNPLENTDTKSNESVVIDGKIVQTGSLIDTYTLSILGLVFIGAGAVISVKKK